MTVEVRLPTILRAHAGRRLLGEGGRHHGRRDLRRPDGAVPLAQGPAHHRGRRPAPFVNVYRNDDDIRYLDAPRHPAQRERRRLDHPRRRRRLSRTPGSRRHARRQSILDLIGDTPLVAIHALSPEPGVRICAKLEGQNPGGSVKDRIALAMVEAAERRGPAARRATPILEPSSGNTGIGLALVCRVQGLPPAGGAARERLPRAPPAARDLRRRGHLLAGRGGLQRRHPGGAGARQGGAGVVLLYQYGNPANPDAHYRGHRARDLGATAPRSTCSWPGSAPPARSWAWAAT